MSMSVCKMDNMRYRLISRSPIAKVKRSLFGPVDPEENMNFIQNQLNHEFNRGCVKWNFNFRDEKTLDPNGDFIWQTTASPILLNRKRKSTEIVENSAYYFQPIEPVARSNESSPKIKMPKQTQITDYMVKSKRPVVCTKEPANERPKKIPKLAEFCSS